MSDATNQLVEHFFRHESARLVAVLARVFGLSRLELVEDTVQAALVEALQVWKTKGVPDNPAAWVHRVAKNKAIDVIRREKRERNVTEQIAVGLALATNSSSATTDWERLFDESEISDSMLKMIFACCSPMLDHQSQIALCLKILCGFSVREIASAFLIETETAKKRVQRAKQTLKQSKVKLELPASDAIAERLASVHEVLYLMFNEGYSSTTGTESIREDVCEEAARLCHLLCQKPSTCNSSTQALLALMLFHAARFGSRTEPDGGIVCLKEQDRSRWDHKLIAVAETWLSRSAVLGDMSTFHLEAGIAMQHCKAKDYDDTHWEMIVRLYDRLIELLPTPIYVLNRAIARAELGHIDRALDELLQLADEKQLKKYSYLDCALAYVYELNQNFQEGRKHWEFAFELATSEHERNFIQKQLGK